MYGWGKSIAQRPCKPPSTLETFGEKAAPRLVPVLKGDTEEDKEDDKKIVKSRVRGFSRAELEGWAYVLLGMSLKDVSVCFQGLAIRSRRDRRRFVPGSLEISLVPSLHRASTDSLISHAN